MADPRDPDLIQIINKLQGDLDELTKNVIARNGRIPHIATDPASPPDGSAWIRSDDRGLRYRANGTTIALPRGYIASQTGDATVPQNTTAAFGADLSGTSANAALVNGRRYLVNASCLCQSTVVNDYLQFRFLIAGSEPPILRMMGPNALVAGFPIEMVIAESFVWSFPSATVACSLQYGRFFGTGTISGRHDIQQPRWLLTDIGV